MLLGELLEDLNEYIRIHKNKILILRIVSNKKDKEMFERFYTVNMRTIYEIVRHIERTTGKKIDKFIDNKMNVIYIREVQSIMKQVKPDTNYYFTELSMLLKKVDRTQNNAKIKGYGKN